MGSIFSSPLDTKGQTGMATGGSIFSQPVTTVGYKPTTSKPTLSITPTQKKLSPDQLTQVGLDKQQAVLKQAPKQTLWQNITTKFNEIFNENTASQKARAMNAVAVKSQPYGKNLDVVKLAEPGGNPLKNTLMEDVTKELGIRTAPTTKEFGETILTLALGTGLVTAPLKTLGMIGTFAGLNEFKSGLISVIKGKGFKIGANQTLSDIVPNANPSIKNVLDLVDFLATAKLSEKVIKSSPEAFEKLTKDTIIKYKMPETVKIPASEVKKVVIGTNEGIEKDILSKLNLTSEQWSKAVKEGIAIDVPAEKITRIVDKPYWEKLKSLIGKEPTNIVNVEGGGKSKVNDVKALLGPGEHTPQEVIGKVIGQGVEKTPEGKALLKQAVEAQKTGSMVSIPKNYTPLKPPVEEGVSRGTTPPLSPIVKQVSGGEVGKEPVIAPKPVLQPTEKITAKSTIGTPKLAEGVKRKALQNKIIYGFDKTFNNLREYDKVDVKEQGSKATELVLNDPENAFQIAMGKLQPPSGILPESVFVAVENYAIETKNVEVLRQLATNSELTQSATSMGQRIRMLAERNPHSAVKLINDIVKTRKEANIKKYGKDAVKNIKKDIKKQVKAPDKYDWSKFLDSIEC